MNRIGSLRSVIHATTSAARLQVSYANVPADKQALTHTLLQIVRTHAGDKAGIDYILKEKSIKQAILVDCMKQLSVTIPSFQLDYIQDVRSLQKYVIAVTTPAKPIVKNVPANIKFTKNLSMKDFEKMGLDIPQSGPSPSNPTTTQTSA
eukprot:TRINITY_DN12248_c0_g1::TRINITY_DN12248_c0_g1_i1::g.13003::m.13003 TRINITY_DN12248_c0_g1::TRINITY_DN12248_c0_g1_i1::g.13003  ORF type:complete len:169 (+),score=33.76,Baculo_LEF5/PF04838.7/2.1e+03,Baculo_LEF5/PF04838.7/0.16 TRINITY_DN12248_c0_g1_i1:61-507(+)